MYYVTIKTFDMSKTKTEFTWKRFWKNFDLASKSITKLCGVIIAIVLVIYMKQVKGIMDKPELAISFVAAISAIIWGVNKKPKSPV